MKFLIMAVFAVSAQAQWMHYPTPAIRHTRDGKPNLTGRVPRVNGKPDLSGLWQAEPTPIEEIRRLFGPGIETLSVPGDDIRTFSKYAFSIMADFKPEDAPIRPEAAKVMQRHLQGAGKDNPTTQCLPGGIPFGQLLPFPSKLIQTPGLIVILQESEGSVRQIFTDGRKHTPDPQPSWMGYSVGKWEGDTLVADTTGFNDLAWMDGSGVPRSEALRLTERYHRRDLGHLDVEVTIDDAKVFSKTFSIKYTLDLVPDSEVAEFVCNENEKDRAHIGK